jgi:DNA-binding GntR family transcriptional regulator
MHSAKSLKLGFQARRSTPDLIADELRDAIFDGRVAGGAQLKQSEIAAEFGVSIVPVREAFQRLVADGLAKLSPNRGVTVTRVSERDFHDITELRTLLEPHALRLSAPHLTADDLIAAEGTLIAAGATPDRTERAKLHWDFHRALYAKADRPRLLAQIGGLHVNITRYLLPLWARVGLSKDWVNSHLEIVTAIRDGDIDHAALLIVDQINEASTRVSDVLRSLEERSERKT